MKENKVKKMSFEKCVSCDLTEEKMPLISITYKGNKKRICLNCLPQMLHGKKNIDDYL